MSYQIKCRNCGQLIGSGHMQSVGDGHMACTFSLHDAEIDPAHVEQGIAAPAQYVLQAQDRIRQQNQGPVQPDSRDEGGTE